MHCLVTGAAGFLGSHLCRTLLHDGHSVVGLDDLSGGFRENLPDGLRFVQGSILDSDAINALFEQEHFDYVYHLAAYAAEGLSHFIKRFNYLNNVIGSVNLINASVNYNISCFVFTSSIAVYGDAQPPMHEDLTPHPLDSYGVAKYTVEQELRISNLLFDLDYVIFRPHNIYGDYQNLGDPYRNVVGIFMNRIMKGQSLPIFGDGLQQRAFTYVGDIIGAIAKVPEVPEARNSIFNLGADTPYTVKELAEMCCEVMAVPVNIEYLPAREEVKVAYSDHTRANEILGVKPNTTLHEGLSRVATWAKERGPIVGKPFKGIEIAKNLPPSWRALIAQNET
jgi:UDP-glucose 4-epimerase